MDGLERELKAKPPDGFSRLSDAQLRHLADAIEATRRAHAAELRAAGEKAWGHIPWLLRGPVRKIMG